MSNIDERIVEMKFENHLFEKNVHTSIGTLEKLKAALKFDGADKSLDNVQKSVNAMDFSRMADGIDALNKRFSAFGIAGMTVIQDLTRAAEGMLKKVYDNTLGQIKTGGWSRATNVDQAKFLIEGLGHTWEEVSDSIDYAVKSTAYGMDEAAKAAAQFLASGVKAGDQMNYSLRAISGVAAMTNTSYSEIAHIFTTISGQGKVTAEQLNQLASRGLNAAAELAKQMNVTEEEVRKMVTKGEVSFDKFAKAMDDAYGKHAKEANKTFEGSMANMKAALSRIGEKIFAPIRKEAVPIFNALREGIDNIKNALADSGVFDKFAHFLETVSKFSVNIIGKLFGNVSWITELGKGIGGAIETLDNGIAKVDGFFKGVSEASKKIESAALTIERVDELANQVIRGDFGNGEARFKALDELTGIEGSWKTIQNRVNELLGCSFRYDDAIEAVKGSTDDLRVTAEYTGKSLRDQVGLQENAKFALEDLGKAIHDSVGEAEQLSIFEWAASVIAGFKAVSSTAGNLFSSVVKGMTGPLISIGKTVATAFGNATSTMAGWFTSFGQWMLDVNAYEKIQNGVNFVFTKFQNILSGVSDAGGKVFTALGGVFTKIGSGVSSGIGKVQEFFSAFTETEGFLKAKTFFSDLGTQILTVKDNIVNGIVDTFNNFANTDFKLPEIDMGALVSSASEKLSMLIDKISEAKENIVSFFTAKFSDEGSIFGKIASFFSNLDWSEVLNNLLSKLHSVGSAIGDVFGTASGIVLSAWDSIKKAFGGITDTITSFKDSIDFGDLFDGILGKVSGLGDKFKGIRDTIKGLFGKDIVEESPLFNGELKDKFSGIRESFSGVNKVASKFTALFSSNKDINKFSVVTDKVSATMSKVATKLTPEIGKSAGGIISTLIDAIGRIVTAIGGFATKAVPLLITGISRAIAFAADAATTIVPIIMDIVSIAAPMLLGAIKAVLEFAREFIKIISAMFSGSNSTKAESMASKFASGIAGIVMFIANDIFPILGDAVEGIFTALGKLVKMGAEFVAKDPIKAILTAFTGINIARGISAVISLFEGFAGLASKIKGAITEWSKATKRVSKATARELNARAILEVALAIGILAASFYALGNMDSGQFKQAIAGIVILGAVLAGLMFVLGKFFGNKQGAAGTPLTPLQTLQQSIADFGSKVSDSLKKFGVAAIIGSFAVAITAMVVAISKLGKLPVGTLIQGGVAVAAIIASLTGAIILMNKFGSENIKMSHAAIIIGFAIAVKTMADAIANIGSLSSAQFIQGIGGVTAIFTGLVGLTFMLSKMKDVKPGPIVAMMGLMIAIAGSLLALSFMKPARLKAAANSIMKIMLSMAVLTLAFNSLSKVKTGDAEHMWKAFGVISLFFAEIAAVLAAFTLMDDSAIKKLPDIADSLSEMMIGLGLLAAGFGIFHKYGGGDWGKGDWILLALGALVGIVAGIAGYLDDLGYIKIESMVADIEKGSELMKALGEAVGSLINGFVTGFLGFDFAEAIKEAVDDVKNLPTKLLEWIQSFGPLLDEIDKINSDHDYSDSTTSAVSRATSFVEAIAGNIADAAIHIQEIKDSKSEPDDVKNIVGKWVTAVTELGTAVSSTEFNGEEVVAQFGYVEDVIKKISTISGYINGGAEGGSKIGTSELTNILTATGSMQTMAEHMKKYAETIKGVDSDAVTSTGYASQIIATLGGQAAKVGQDSIMGQAMGGSLIGNGSIDYFANQLQPFAEGMVKYSEEIKKMVGNVDAVTGTENAVSIITTLAGKAAEVGNAIQLIQDGMGNQMTSIDLFSEPLGKFATAMKIYAANIDGMKSGAVTKSKEACDMIIDLAGAIPDQTGGLLGLLLGNDMELFSTNLPILGTAISDFCLNIDGADPSSAQNAIKVVQDLSKTFTDMQQMGELTGGTELQNKMDQMETVVGDMFQRFAYALEDVGGGAALIEFNGAMQDFGAKLGEEVSKGMIDGISNTEIGTELQTAMNSLLSDMMSSFTYSESDESAVPQFMGLFDDLIKTINQQQPFFRTGGNNLANALSIGIGQGRSWVRSALQTIGNTGFTTINAFQSRFRTAGNNLMNGFASGIRQGKSWVVSAVRDAANAAVAAANEELEINSPSHVFQRIGSGVDEGFAKGIIDNTGMIVKATKGSLSQVTDSMSRSINSGADDITAQLVSVYQYINSVINESLDTSPVITPVVDLSQVQNGMYSAGAMLSSAGNAFGAGALSYARSNFPGSYSYGLTSQGASNVEVVRALNGVRSDLKDLGEALSAMDMVLDNGVLVGQMGTGMDRQLGTIQKFKERWA